eukprot:s4549_g3.t1
MSGAWEAALLVEVPETASEWQVQILSEFMHLVGVRVTRSQHTGSPQRILKLANLEEVQQEDKSTLVPDANDALDAHEVSDVSGIFNDVVVQSLTSEGLGGHFKIRIPEGATVGLLRELVAGRCGGGGVAAHIRMVRRFTDVLFLPLDDCEPVRSKEVLLLGIDLAGVEAETAETDFEAGGVETKMFVDTEDDGALKTRESISLLMAAMELLEDPQVQELFMGLDTVSEILAAWEPPWISSGFHDLDAQTLQTVAASTIQGWAQSFSQLVAKMTATARNDKAPASMRSSDARITEVKPDNEDAHAEVPDEVESDNGKGLLEKPVQSPYDGSEKRDEAAGKLD